MSSEHNLSGSPIVESIIQQKCVLVLGPDMAFESRKSLLRELSGFLETKRFKHEFIESEELFASSTKFKPLGYMHIPKFFEALEPAEVHNLVADIPFHLVISLSPDLLLKQVFDSKNFDYSFSYYHRGRASEELTEKPTKDKPLIYNLLGSYKQNTSLVLTFNDLFDYLVSVLGKFELPQVLRNELDEAYTFLFFGFKYDNWYFRLIMKLLNKDDNIIRQAPFEDIKDKEEVISFYTDELGLSFFEEGTGIDIIRQLHDYFGEQNMLRQPKKEEPAQGGNTIIVHGDDNIIVQDVKSGQINISKSNSTNQDNE